MTTGPVGPTAVCLPLLSGSKDTDHHTPERLLQVHCVTNRSRQPPTHKLENDNLRDDCYPLKSRVKTEHFFFYSTSEGVVIATALRVGDCAAENIACTCQSTNQTLYLCHMWLRSIRLLLPSAGLLVKRTVMDCKEKFFLNQLEISVKISNTHY